MKKLTILALLLVSIPALANETCYQVSATEGVWSRTPELLCVDEDNQTGKVMISLKTGLSFSQTTVATFNLSLLERARCIDCNRDVFGLANPSNSSFNALSIHFNGTRDRTTMKEEGIVSIGETVFFYRSY